MLSERLSCTIYFVIAMLSYIPCIDDVINHGGLAVFYKYVLLEYIIILCCILYVSYIHIYYTYTPQLLWTVTFTCSIFLN